MVPVFAITIGVVLLTVAQSKVTPEIRCTSTSLDVRVNREGVENVELEKWSRLPGCEATFDDVFFLIQLKLTSDLPCGTTRIRNKKTDESVYYHKIAITESNGTRHLYKVSCSNSIDKGLSSNIVKRNVLPAEFYEPDFIEITSEVTGTAPIPELSVGVRQNGNLIGDQVTVSPGAPLSMEVYLDSDSSSIYGILVSYMMVTDTTDKNETIIFNGCTQDRYVFENFQTKDGDFLTAKFRAFKFPESNYLLFRGTVDVCLDKCQGISCSSGEIGYGRKRRAIPRGADPNKIFEVTMMTFIEIEDDTREVSAAKLNTRGVSMEFDNPSTIYTGEESTTSLKNSLENYGSPPYIFFQTNQASSTLSSLSLLGATVAVALNFVV